MADDRTLYAQPMARQDTRKVPPTPKGETPLGAGPAWQGRGGEIGAARVYAFQKFANTFGRNPSQSELDRLAQAYVGADRNVANVGGGDAAVSQYFQMLQNSPDVLQEEGDAKLKEKIPQQYDSVKGAFKSALGRDPSQAELDHFAKMMANGEADSYTIEQGLQTLPEYTTGKDQEARTKLRGELQTADTDYLTNKVAPSLQSYFAQQGRVADQSSPALSAALANASKQTNDERERYLATVGREDYTNSRQATINNYLQTLQRQYQLNDSATGRMNQLQDQNTARNYDLQDYYQQQSAYNDYLQNYGRRKTKSSSGLYGGGGALLGMGLGAALAAPTGGMSIPMGMMLGGGAGGTAGKMFDY